MQFVPRRHQQLALDFLRAHDNSGLFLDMGLGKTVVTLTFVKRLLDDFAIDQVLVIAPKRVAEETWSTEASKWDHLTDLRISKVLGTEKQRLAALEQKADIYVINRENVVWLVEKLGTKWPFDMVVIDELSSFKSSRSKRWRSLKRVIKLNRHVIGLTGTPAPNGYIDLWPQVYLLDGGQRLGRTLGEFRTKYFSPGAHKGHIVYEWKLKRGAKDDIDRRLKDLCLSMSKEDWLQMPPLITNRVTVRMDPSEAKLYEQLKTDKVLPLLDGAVADMQDFDRAVVGATAATLSGKLLQMANGAVYDDGGGVLHIHDKKLDALEGILDEAQGEPVLVFYSYKHDLSRIKERFSQAEELGTGTIERWNRGEVPMLLCHPASCSYGLNLQGGGHIMVWFGLPWSAELYAQASARLYRLGQERPVIMHHILCAGTLDERVMEVLDRKDDVQRGLMDALKRYVLEGQK